MSGGDLDDRFPAVQIKAALKQRLDEQREKIPAGSPTARAIDYSRRQWQALTHYRPHYVSAILVLAWVKLASMGMRV
jgi:hypothetical protein